MLTRDSRVDDIARYLKDGSGDTFGRILLRVADLVEDAEYDSDLPIWISEEIDRWIQKGGA